jgi:hypothetical protein
MNEGARSRPKSPRLSDFADLPLNQLAERAPQAFQDLKGKLAASRSAVVLAALRGAPPKVVRAVSKARLAAQPIPDKSFVEEIVDALKRAKTPQTVLTQAEMVLDQLANAGRLPDPGRSVALLRDHPVTRDAVDRARLSAVLDRAGLSNARMAKLRPRFGGMDSLGTRDLDALVDDGTLTKEEAERINLAAVAVRLTGSTGAAIDAVFNLKEESGREPRVRKTADLAALETGDWRAVFDASEFEPPPGFTRDSFAREITDRVARVLPTDFLMHRATAIPRDLVKVVEDIGTARRNGDSNSALRLARRNPGLLLDDILASEDSTETKAAEIRRRVGLIADVWSGNPDTDFLTLDYSVDSADQESLEQLPVDRADRRLVLDTLKGQQRAFLTAQHAGTAIELLDAGFDAARKIVALQRDDFRQASGLSDDRSLAVYRNAQALAIGAGVKAIAILQSGRPGGAPVALRTSAATAEYLARIPGYETLFQTFGFCECDRCQSVLGLSAYFVDLMYFVEKNIIDRPENFRSRPDHPLHLKTRRLDLWDLDLTCANATEVVAYLDVINEVLELHLKSRVALPAAADIWERIAARNPSFSLPLHWPLERIETYLGHFNTRRFDASAVCRAGEPAETRARLRVSEIEYAMIATPAAGNFSQLNTAEQDFLSKLYPSISVYANGSVETTGFSVVFVAQLLKATGASREALGELLASAFVLGNTSLEVRSGRAGTESIQNDTEIVEGLRAQHLDRLHRFFRLSRRLPWSIPELDLVLARLISQGLVTGLGDDAMRLIARLVGLQERLGLSAVELIGLWSDLPNEAPEGTRGFFDALFNPPQFNDLGQPIAYEANPNTSFLHPSFNSASPPAGGNSNPQDNTLARLLSGLRVTDQELVQLLTLLAVPLGLDPASAVAANRRLRLSIGNLTLLYRHATLSRRLKRSIPELFQLLDLAGVRHPVGTATLAFVDRWSLAGATLQDDLTTVAGANDWIKTAPFLLDEIAFIAGRPVRSPELLPDSAVLTAGVIEQLRLQRAFEFADTVLSGLPNGTIGLTEEQSRQIVALNESLFDFDEAGTTLRLKATVTPEPAAAQIQIPPAPDITVSAAAVAERLAGFSMHRLLPTALASALNVPRSKLEALLRAAAQQQVLDSPAFLQDIATLAHGAEIDRTRLNGLVGALTRYALLYRTEDFGAEAVEFIRLHDAAFGQSAGLSVDAVRLAAQFHRLVSGPNPSYATSAVKPDPAAVRSVVDGGVAAASAASLASALRTDAARIDGLRPHLLGQLPANPLDALAMLARCLDLIELLGISGETLKDVALTAVTPPPPETEYQRLRRAADGLFAAFRAKYQGDAQFRKKVEPYEDTLRSRKRDGLVAYLRFTDPLAFGEQNDLYHYFLLDVQLEGCARTTRVAAAVFSLQLYVHRVLMQLERSDVFAVSSRAVPREEWAWRQHYRLWEANRKVFLYPENYLEPSLRDDKTPLFKELEDTLLQQDVTEQNVRNAFAAYLSGFHELANLRIAAACSQRLELAGGGSRDVLHLFGVTSADPPAFFYQSVEGIHSAAAARDAGFSAWRPINVSIPARHCGAALYRGTLYLFWAEIVTEPRHLLLDGDSFFVGYRHRVGLRFSSLQLDGRWTAPQRLRIVQPNGQIVDRIIVNDPLQPFVASTSVGAGGVVDLPAAGTAGADGGSPAPPPPATPPSNNFPVALLDTLKRNHRDPIDDYTLTGPAWDTPYPIEEPDGSLSLAYGYTPFTVDLFEHTAVQRGQVFPDQSTTGLMLVRDAAGTVRGVGRGAIGLGPALNAYHGCATALRDGITDAAKPLLLQPVGALELVAVNGSPDSCIVRVADALFFARAVANANLWTCRLGSTVARSFGETLFNGNIESLLAIAYQNPLTERPAPFALPGGGTAPDDPRAPFDYRSAPGRYYREIFAHGPWLIAEHLHGQGQFAAAQRWLHFIMNPAAENLPPANPEYKRVWQFREFREEPVASLRAALEDQRALEVYRRDPFSPHAIARLRPGAYEKAVVMQYIDNLLDWADSLFAQFTAESINEATMLYILAADLLGPRALDVGDCGEGMPADTRKNYENLAPSLRAGHVFLIEAETQWVAGRLEGLRQGVGVLESAGLVFTRSAATAAGGPAPPPFADVAAGGTAPALAGVSQPFDWHRSSPAMWSTTGSTPMADLQLGNRVGENRAPMFPDPPGGLSTFRVQPDPLNPPEVGPPELSDGLVKFDHLHPGFELRDLLLDDYLRKKPVDTQVKPNVEPWQLLDTSIVFCIPDNKELRAYWDRVAARLHNIRNCRDITGVRRIPELFGPEIDPRLLIKMKAAGLSLEDVLSTTPGSVPPYRFTYLMERARQYTATVKEFGNALLSALEKRDAEALNRLRTVHEQHLLKLRTRLQELEIANAQQTLASLQLQRQTQGYRRDYYATLSQTGLTGWERTLQGSQHSANALVLTAGVLSGGAGILSLLPQLGAPTAMKYGGVELNSSLKGWALMARDTAKIAELVASSAKIEAEFQRRDDEWKHQAAVAQREFDQIDRQVAAAEIRVALAERSLEVHNESVAQTEELFEFYQDRFTSADLYTTLSKRLHQLHRDAFNAAFSMAAMAERAYRFERPEDSTTRLSPGQWNPATGGLLAGEQLQLDLQALERKYLETDVRRFEIEQSFSLAQFDPAALVALREQGDCTFLVPEVFYDLAYPGHYRRRIKAVRLNVPCVAGPFVNVSATLKLLDSRIRLDPDSEAVAVPARHSVSIAASSGQNDAGVFEFSFRDERYMPFEGGGAVSTWQLSLPKTFRLFDYETIADVILRISYSALNDEDLRANVEDATGEAERAILGYLQTNELQAVVSMRRDQPDTFVRLTRSPPDTAVPFSIERRRLPWFIGERPLTIAAAHVLLRTSRREDAPTLTLSLNGSAVGEFSADARSGVTQNAAGNDEYTLFTSGDVVDHVGNWFGRSHTVTLTSAGDVASAAGGELTLDTAAVLDVLLDVRYTVTP